MGIRERKEREKGARREDILDAARAVFFERGFQGATVDEIARRVELSKGTLYLYYRSKQDLYVATALQGSEILRTMFSEAASTGEQPLTLLSNTVNAYVRFFMEYRNHFRISCFLGNADIRARISEMVRQGCGDSNRRIWEIVSTVMQRVIDEGMMRDGVEALEAGVLILANADRLLRLMDDGEKSSIEMLGLDLMTLLGKSNRLLVEALLTEKGRQMMDDLHKNIEDSFPGRLWEKSEAGTDHPARVVSGKLTSYRTHAIAPTAHDAI